ncbi:MAG: tetratricopeptide repeat protein [Vicinamibacterales bacterium]
MSSIYAAVATYPFVNWDDGEYVAANARVLRGLDWSGVAWAFTSRVAGNWHPLTMISHMADVTWFGPDAGAHHLVNVALHVVASVALFVALRGLTGASGRSAFVAAVFAAHPLHVESVAWVSERKDVLSTALLMLALCGWAGFVRRPTWARYAVTFGLYVLALLAKPMVVTLPLVLVLLDVWPLGRVPVTRFDGAAWRRVLMEKVPFLLAAFAVGLATLSAQGGAVAGLGALPLGTRLANAVGGYALYLAKAAWPVRLAAFYPMQAYPPAWLAGVAVALLAVTVAAVLTVRRWPVLFAGWGWFLVTLLPVSGVIQTGEQAIADRYMYVPLVGLAIAVAWGAVAAAEHWRIDRRVVAASGAAVVLVLAGVARAQVRTWADSETLWRHAIAVTERNYRAHDKLGEALRDQGRLDEAYAEYERALALAPPQSPRYQAIEQNSLGLVRARQGRADDARAHFEEAVALDPGFPEAQGNLGAALATVGRLDEAADHFDRALALTPDAPEVLAGLAGVRLTQGRADEALPLFSRAVSARPDMAEAHAGLGAAAAALGRKADAYTAFAEAIRLEPDRASVRIRLANLLAADGRPDEAIAELDRAIRIDPRQPTWHYGLAVLLSGRGRTADARRELEAALRLRPDYPDALDALRRLGG